PRDEPDVEVRAAVTPAVEMHPADVAEREDSPLDTCRDASEVRGQLVRQIGERVDVLAARKPDGSRQAALHGRLERPRVVRPDSRRRPTGADAAGRAAGLAAPRRLGYLPRPGFAEDERLVVGKSHRVSFPLGARPSSTTATIPAFAVSAGHPWRPLR